MILKGAVCVSFKALKRSQKAIKEGIKGGIVCGVTATVSN